MTLKDRRLQAGLRQDDIAKALEVDQAAVSRWESGETRPVRKYRAKLAAFYGVTVDELLSADHSGGARSGAMN